MTPVMPVKSLESSSNPATSTSSKPRLNSSSLSVQRVKNAKRLKHSRPRLIIIHSRRHPRKLPSLQLNLPSHPRNLIDRFRSCISRLSIKRKTKRKVPQDRLVKSHRRPVTRSTSAESQSLKIFSRNISVSSARL